jgi:hypothetical protein
MPQVCFASTMRLNKRGSLYYGCDGVVLLNIALRIFRNTSSELSSQKTRRTQRLSFGPANPAVESNCVSHTPRRPSTETLTTCAQPSAIIVVLEVCHHGI